MKNEHTIVSFGKASMALAEFLKESRQLEPDDQTFIENHMLITQLAYRSWKYGQQKKRDSFSKLSGESLGSI